MLFPDKSNIGTADASVGDFFQNINKFVNGFRHPHKESFNAEEKNDTNPSRYDTIYKRIFPVLTDRKTEGYLES